MSTCISRHGEFSEHTLDDSYTCTLCHVPDEDALRAELEEARRERDSLGRRCAVRFGEAEEARAEASQARDERDKALAEVERLRKLIEPLREWRALWHPDSTPFPQEQALIAAVDAYENYAGDEPGGNAPVESAHDYTGHGHPCCGEAPVRRPANIRTIAKCGGPGMCEQCADDRDETHSRAASVATTNTTDGSSS